MNTSLMSNILIYQVSAPFMTVDAFGERFNASKYARRFRYKNRATRTNDRTGNKKKLRSARVF